MLDKEYGLITDLFFNSFLERDSYVLIKDIDNPTFRMGNRLYLKLDKGIGELEEDFNKEFKENKQVESFVFTFNNSSFKLTDKFKNSGYEIEQSYVLKLADYKNPRKINTEIKIKELKSKTDWDKMILNQNSARTSSYPKKDFINYITPKVQKYRKIINNDKGNWYGAYINNELIADTGIFFNNGIARFQLVATNPKFRRRGVCSSLLDSIISIIKEKTIIILADPDYHALDLYLSLGFEKVYLETTAIKIRA